MCLGETGGRAGPANGCWRRIETLKDGTDKKKGKASVYIIGIKISSKSMVERDILVDKFWQKIAKKEIFFLSKMARMRSFSDSSSFH